MTLSNRQMPESRQADDAPSLGQLDFKRIGGGLADLYEPVTREGAPQMPSKLRDLIKKLEETALGKPEAV